MDSSSVATVTHTYEAASPNALSLTAGAKVEVLSSGNSEWWYISYNGTKGYFPATCLAAIAAEKPLPPGWKKHLSPDQRVYYYNQVTGVSQWTVPTSAPEPSKPQPPPPPPRVAKATPDPQRNIISSNSTLPSVQAPPAPAAVPAAAAKLGATPSPPAGSKLLPRPAQPPPPPPVNRSLSNPMPIAYSSPAAALQAADVMTANAHRPQSSSIQVSSAVEGTAGSKGLSGVLSRERSDSKPSSPGGRVPLENTARRTSFKMAAMARAVDSIVEHHALPTELQNDIMNFSITGYATDHFKKQKKWGIFGRKYIKPSQIVISYTKKYNTSLTVLSQANEKRAMLVFGLICDYMESEMCISDRKFVEVVMEVNRCLEAGMIDEVYCQLIKQTTDNPNSASMEKGWELMYAICTFALPTNQLMRVVAGHSTNMRFMSNSTGALAMAVHSTLCGHLKHHEVGSPQPLLLRADELSYEEHILPIKSFWLPEKCYGCRVEQVILHEVFHRDPDGVCPLYSELMDSRDAVPELLVLLCEYILENGGKTRGGIFREAADVDTVKGIMAQLEVGNYQSILVGRARAEHSRGSSVPSEADGHKRRGSGSSSSSSKRKPSAPPTHNDSYIPISDVLVACDLLKLWFRRMPEPVTGFALYEHCVSAGRRDDPLAAQAVLDKLPPLNWSVLRYLSNFLRELSLTSHITNMEITNLSLVFAPNCIKSPSDDPRVFAANADDERRCFRLFVDILCPPEV